MGALLSRVGREIGDRVEGAVALGDLFRAPAAEAGELLRTARALLEQWQSTYMQARRARGGRAPLCPPTHPPPPPPQGSATAQPNARHTPPPIGHPMTKTHTRKRKP
jgi:hypothetical protein